MYCTTYTLVSAVVFLPVSLLSHLIEIISIHFATISADLLTPTIPYSN